MKNIYPKAACAVRRLPVIIAGLGLALLPIRSMADSAARTTTLKARYDRFYLHFDAPKRTKNTPSRMVVMTARSTVLFELTLGPKTLVASTVTDGKLQQPTTAKLNPASAAFTFSRRLNIGTLYHDGHMVWTTDTLPIGPLKVALTVPPQKKKLRIQKLADFVRSDDFMRTDVGNGDGWRKIWGAWRTLSNPRAVASPNPFKCIGAVRYDKPAVIIMGYRFWNHYDLSTSLKPSVTGTAGLIFSWRGPKNFLKAVVTAPDSGGSKVILSQVRDGRETVLGSAPILDAVGRWISLQVTNREGVAIRVSIDGVAVVDGPSGLDGHGKVGYIVSRDIGTFDDFMLKAGRDLPPIISPYVRSLAYGNTPRKPQDNRDGEVRWARDTDAWKPAKLIFRGKRHKGITYHLPLFGNFELKFRSRTAAVVLRLQPWSGDSTPLTLDIKPGKHTVARRGATITIDDKEAGELEAGAVLTVFAPPGKAWRALPPTIRCASLNREMFEKAAIDWFPLGGTWENTTRWQCAQQWNFYGGVGTDLVAQISKHSTTGDQVHEVYFAMKDIFDLQYHQRRYIRRDVNLSFLTDGKDLFSGYTVMFGGHKNTGTYLYRGRTRVATNKDVKFPRFYSHPNLNSVKELHWLWQKFRIEKRGARIRIFLDDTLLFDRLEKNTEDIPRGGHLIMWTRRNGFLCGRVNSSAASQTLDAGIFVSPGDRALRDSAWQPLEPRRVTTRAVTGKAGVIDVVNRFGGGFFAVSHTFRKTVDLSKTPRLRIPMEIPKGVKVNLHVIVSGRAFIIPLTAPMTDTYRVLGENRIELHPWSAYSRPDLSAPFVKGRPAKTITGTWEIDLLKETKQRIDNASTYTVNSLIIGNSSHKNYLIAGLAGNHAGATYRLGTPKFLPKKK